MWMRPFWSSTIWPDSCTPTTYWRSRKWQVMALQRLFDEPTHFKPCTRRCDQHVMMQHPERTMSTSLDNVGHLLRQFVNHVDNIKAAKQGYVHNQDVLETLFHSENTRLCILRPKLCVASKLFQASLFRIQILALEISNADGGRATAEHPWIPYIACLGLSGSIGLTSKTDPETVKSELYAKNE